VRSDAEPRLYCGQDGVYDHCMQRSSDLGYVRPRLPACLRQCTVSTNNTILRRSHLAVNYVPGYRMIAAIRIHKLDVVPASNERGNGEEGEEGVADIGGDSRTAAGHVNLLPDDYSPGDMLKTVKTTHECRPSAGRFTILVILLCGVVCLHGLLQYS